MLNIGDSNDVCMYQFSIRLSRPQICRYDTDTVSDVYCTDFIKQMIKQRNSLEDTSF